MQGSRHIRGITGIWPLKASSADNYDKYIILTFVNGTRIFESVLNDQWAVKEMAGFDSEVETIFCQNVAYEQILQVCLLTNF